MRTTVRRLRVIVAVLGASLAIVAAVGPVAAAPRPEPVAIDSVIMLADSGPNDGAFTRTGSDLICASGTVIDTRYVWGGEGPHGAQLVVDKTFTCADGAFFVRLQVHGVFVSETFTWVVLGGTGAYAHLHGHGHGFTVYNEGWVENYYTGFLVG
jgi:hypothetical protein